MKASVERADVSRSIEVSMSPGRDYAALVELLSQLSRVPDGLGETILTEEEAEQICALVFPAAPGKWLVPMLPHDLVRGNGLLECLSDAWAQEESVEPGDRIWSQDEIRVFEASQRAGRWAKRRTLQKRLWRMGARRFNEALASLQKSGVLELNGSMVWLRVTELSANLQTPENAALFQPVETVSVHRKDRRSERLTG